MAKKMKVHFMGIGGSGMSAAAALALAQGFDVSGCDVEVKTPYTEKIQDKIKISTGHSQSHLDGIDLLVVSPAIYYLDPKPGELENAKKVMTWQEFIGKYLMDSKENICVSGTHGKSTTTAILADVFIEASLDPTVVLGAKVLGWETNYREGKGDYFIVEADEFNDNFLNYSPEAIILNNIEFDHPDYFEDKAQVVNSFRKHIESLIGKKILVANIDSPEVKDLVNEFTDVELITYSLVDKSADYYGEIIEETPETTSFAVGEDAYEILLAGEYNVSNALGVIAMAQKYGIHKSAIHKVLKSFSGLGRRMELIGEYKGAKIYDDYGHHPTAIAVTLSALRQKHPDAKITAIVEPHSYSRTKALLPLYNGAFAAADEVFIAPIFKARDNETFGITEQSIVDVSGHSNIKAGGTFADIVKEVQSKIEPGDVVIVMGAGKSYELARALLTKKR